MLLKHIHPMSQGLRKTKLYPFYAPTTTTYTTIPYIRGTSAAISRISSPLGIRAPSPPTNTLQQILVHPKDPIPEQEKLCVYRIWCTHCPKAYIGQTSRTIAQRIKEHQRSVHYSDIATSALAEHSNSTAQPLQWDEAHVINTCPHTSRLCLLESWTIHMEPYPLNS